MRILEPFVLVVDAKWHILECIPNPYPFGVYFKNIFGTVKGSSEWSLREATMRRNYL